MKTQEEHRPAIATSMVTLARSRRPSKRMLSGLVTLWRAMTTQRKVAVGSAILGLFIGVGLIGPILIPIDPNATSHLFIAPPSAAHWLGTTVVGEDIFSQLIYGTRTSVFWGLATALVVTVLSALVVLVGGYLSGLTDDSFTLVTNVSLVLRAVPLAIVLAAYFPRGPLTIDSTIILKSWAWQ